MFIHGPKMILAAATVHSRSSSAGSGWSCIGVDGLALQHGKVNAACEVMPADHLVSGWCLLQETNCMG